MVIEQALLAATRSLKAADIPSPRLEASVLLRHVLAADRAALLRRCNEELTAQAQAQYDALVARRCAGFPTAYLIGKREFMSLEFAVSEAVLIPRPDTELLVETILAAARTHDAPHILDLCCGSGCIGVSLAHYLPHARVTLLDLSPAAVAVAKQNAARLAPDNTQVAVGDAFALTGTYTMIASNPPYIETAVVDGLQTEVRDHEPRLALDGGADGLRFYRHLAKTAQKNLADGGILALEVGHKQARSVAALLKENGWQNIEIKCDLAGIERVVSAQKCK